VLFTSKCEEERLMGATVEKVESLSGLTLLPDQIKATSKHICKSVKCEVVVRRFDDAQKRVGGRK
jgi:endonuclease G